MIVYIANNPLSSVMENCAIITPPGRGYKSTTRLAISVRQTIALSRWSGQRYGEEFTEYGLPQRLVWIVGSLKVTAATALILSIFIPSLTLPAAALISVLMAGAIAMHVRIKDRLVKSVPAATLLVMTLVVAAT